MKEGCHWNDVASSYLKLTHIPAAMAMAQDNVFSKTFRPLNRVTSEHFSTDGEAGRV